MKAEPKHADDNGDDGDDAANNFEARQEIFQRSDEEVALAARQFTVAGVVSTKQWRLEDASANTPPLPSYTSNCTKELLCLEYVANFQRQFEYMFPARKPLYLFPPNEHGTPKLVCTTLRPTLLPYRDLYDAQALARFLAGVLEYEPLADPLSPPKCLPSPGFTLKARAGDSFDFAVVFASFLIGAGYDAYVVHGIAPRWICLLDQSKTPLPTLAIEEQSRRAKGDNSREATASTSSIDPISQQYPNARATSVNGASSNEDTKLASRSTFTSKYVTMQQAQLEKSREDNQARESHDQIDVLYDDDDDDDDPLEGKRVHAWVLVRAGKRNVTEHFFIEASTGRVYPLHSSPYTRIECIWNHENYWVNMQVAMQSVYTTLFDLANPTDWEYVFLSALERKAVKEGIGGGASGGGDIGSSDAKGGSDLADDLKSLHISNGDNQRENDDDENADVLILDVPPSWVAKLALDRTTYKKQFVADAQRVTLYQRAKIEEFAEHSHEQGLVVRTTKYRDTNCTLPIEIREYFRHRKDKLESRVRFPLESKFEEHFGPGRVPEALKTRIEWIGSRREFHFYTRARMDGLKTREEVIQKRTIEHFEGRDDFLVFRSVTLTTDKDDMDAMKNPYVLPGGPTGELTIKKMKEKFARNVALPADDDARKRTYNVHDGTIRVHFHYATGKITAGARVYSKAPNTPVEVVLADPNATRPKASILEDELRASLQMEKDCYSAVRHSEMETQDILKIRKREEMAIVLETSFFDGNDDDDATTSHKDDAKDTGKDTKSEMDYLTPFLQSLHTSHAELTKEDAQSVREMCLRNLKERLLERANIIQARLDKENALLAKRQAAFQRSQREHDQGTDDEFERFCSETMFRIQILEQRLANHEETALQKYADMDQRLHNDPRLRILHR
uniref:Dynein regulatory complex subunit 7 n=1 Tax=Globisporangium ultimum (strain ATCC 200006 / CBS 805.95 / DAOM BR144) TaxID=431595 RepID=K3WB99_GLOUD